MFVYMVYTFDRNATRKTSQIDDYLNQIKGPLATLRALQRFGFFWTPAAEAICLEEFAGSFRLRLSPDAQNKVFTKNGSCIQILDTTLFYSHFV